MASFSVASAVNFSGIKSWKTGAVYPQLQFQNHQKNYRFSQFHFGTALVAKTGPILQRPYGSACVSSAGKNYRLNYNRNPHTELRFWLNPVREVIWAARDTLVFLVEQPSQLKYIEWPSFVSTIKTAFLTLIIVGMLLIALSSVDSVLSYLLAVFLRKAAT